MAAAFDGLNVPLTSAEWLLISSALVAMFACGVGVAFVLWDMAKEPSVVGHVHSATNAKLELDR